MDTIFMCLFGKHSKNLEFTFNSDKSYVQFLSAAYCPDEEVIIPDKHRGKPVKTICRFAFKDSPAKTVQLGKNVEYLLEHWAEGSNLTNIKVAKDNKYFSIHGALLVHRTDYMKIDRVLCILPHEGPLEVSNCFSMIEDDVEKYLLPNTKIGKVIFKKDVNAFQAAYFINAFNVSDFEFEEGSHVVINGNVLYDDKDPKKYYAIAKNGEFKLKPIKEEMAGIDFYYPLANLPIKKLVIEEGLKILKSLGNARFVEEIVFPSSLERIEKDAFLLSERIKKITLPDKITSIDREVFNNLKNLEAFEVFKTNKQYEDKSSYSTLEAKDGVLYKNEYSMTTVCRWPLKKPVSAYNELCPDDCAFAGTVVNDLSFKNDHPNSAISYRAFYKATFKSYINIGNVRLICPNAFEGATTPVRLVLSNPDVRILEDAFKGVSQLSLSFPTSEDAAIFKRNMVNKVAKNGNEAVFRAKISYAKE